MAFVARLRGTAQFDTFRCECTTAPYQRLRDGVVSLSGPSLVCHCVLFTSPFVRAISRCCPQPASPAQVAHTVHKYEQVEAPSTSLSRSPSLPQHAFNASPKEMSISAKGIKKGSSTTAWFSACADRAPVPHADLEVIESCISEHGTFVDAVAHNVWIGQVAHWRHQLILRPRGSPTWYLGLRHFPGSASLVWPVMEKVQKGGTNHERKCFIPHVLTDCVKLLTINSFDNFEAFLFEAHSPAWQATELGEKAWALDAIRFYPKSDPKPLLEVVAEAGFWNLPRQFLQSVGLLLGHSIGSGASVIEASWELSKAVLSCDDEQAAKCVEQRMVLLTREAENRDTNFGECEELDEVLERKDEKAAEVEAKEHVSAQEALTVARDEFRSRVASVSGRRAKAKKVPAPPGRKWPKNVPVGVIDHATGKAMAPPGAVVWRARTDGRWCGKLRSYPEVSRSWARYGERQAMILMLRELWEEYLCAAGMGIEACPIDGIFATT